MNSSTNTSAMTETDSINETVSGTTAALPLFDPGYIMQTDTFRVCIQIIEKKYYYIIPMAVVFNMFCFAVLSTRLRQNPAYMLMGSIAIWDMLTILFRGFNSMITKYNWVLGDNGCRIYSFLMDLTPEVAVWLVVVLTADRCIAVWFPLRHRELCSLKRVMIVYAVVVVISMITVCDHLWLLHGEAGPTGYQCVFDFDYMYIVTRFKWAYVAWYSYTPTVLMVLLNFLLAFKVRRQAALLGGAKQAGGKKGVNIEAHVTRMALLVSVTFVILFVPQCVFNVILIFWKYIATNEKFLTYIETLTVVHLMNDINHIVNPFLYFFSGRRFRQDALALVNKCFCRHSTKTNGKMPNASTSGMVTSVSQVT